VHAELQQKPSTQKLLKQSLMTVQVSPLTFLQAPMPSQDWFAPEQVPVSS
jgi:hypothetical protein